MSKTGYRYPSVASGMLTQAQWAWERGRAPRGRQCAKDRATAHRGKKINLIIAVARAGEGQQIPRPSPMVPSWHTKKEKGRFGVGAGLRGQIPDRSPIFRRPGGPSKAPLAYRPTSSLPNPPGQVSAFKEFVVQVGIVRAARVPSPTWLRPNANTEEEPRYVH